MRGGTFFTLVFPVILTFQSTRPLRGGTPLACVHFLRFVFQSTRPLRGGTKRAAWAFRLPQFQSTRPLRGGTITFPHTSRCRFISIHPPLAGRDAAVSAAQNPIHISIHPPLAGRDDRDHPVRPDFWISIHPPLAGRDPDRVIVPSSFFNFNPPAPCGAGRPADKRNVVVQVFQSTRPLRGGTATFNNPYRMFKFQSTRPLRGGTAILHKKTVQNIAYCTKSAFTLAVLSGFLALMRPFFLPNVHKFRCEPSEESLLAPRSHAYTIRTPSC